MSDTKTTSGGGIGFCGLLTIVFVTLKLCRMIDWSWLWVLSPLWIPFAILAVFGGVVLLIAGVMCLVGMAMEAVETRRNAK